MHRHDTYAIGRTLAGVQSFSYRRSRRNSLAGNTLVLHPDEAHDGHILDALTLGRRERCLNP